MKYGRWCNGRVVWDFGRGTDVTMLNSTYTWNFLRNKKYFKMWTKIFTHNEKEKPQYVSNYSWKLTRISNIFLLHGWKQWPRRERLSHKNAVSS